MVYRYMDSKKIEKRRRKSTAISGIGSLIIGLIFILGGIFFLAALKSLAGLIFMFIFAFVFIAAGIYFFNQIKIEEKRSQALDDPNSRIYKKRQRNIEKRKNKYLSRAEKHKSLKSIMCRRSAFIFGTFTIFAWLLSLILFIAGIFYLILIISDVLLPIAFVNSLFGKQYKSLINEYKMYGIDKSEAERDFSESRAYLISTDVIAISSRFFTASEEIIVLPIENIVWIYTGYDNIHKYSSGMYSHTERKYGVIIGLSDGKQVKVNCPEELCSVIVDDIVKVGISVTVGYSTELQELFNDDPEKFRNAVKTELNITMKPIGSDIQ